MLRAFSCLIALSILGDVISATNNLAAPGPAIGLTILTVAFAWKSRPDPELERIFDLMAPWFPLFFVPSAVGVLAHLNLLSATWLHVSVAILFGTPLALVITGGLAQALLANPEREHSDA